MFVRRQGDLVLVEHDRLATQIQRKLKEIDPKLFLEKQIRISDQAPCWYVMFEAGGDEDPVALCEWSDPTGRPLELSWSLLDRVVSHRLDLSPRRALAAGTAKAANKRKEQEMADWSLNEHVAIAEEVVPMLSPVHSAVLPRGVYLRMSRDKMRARGMKV